MPVPACCRTRGPGLLNHCSLLPREEQESRRRRVCTAVYAWRLRPPPLMIWGVHPASARCLPHWPSTIGATYRLPRAPQTRALDFWHSHSGLRPQLTGSLHHTCELALQVDLRHGPRGASAQPRPAAWCRWAYSPAQLALSPETPSAHAGSEAGTRDAGRAVPAGPGTASGSGAASAAAGRRYSRPRALAVRAATALVQRPHSLPTCVSCRRRLSQARVPWRGGRQAPSR